MKNTFKTIPGFAAYELSTDGTVRRVKPSTYPAGRVLAGKPDRNQRRYSLRKNGKDRSVSLPRLMQKTFGIPAETLHDRARGERVTVSKLKDEDIPEIRELRRHGLSLAAIARQFRVCPTTIHQIVRHRTWRHIQ